jgi:uncharacterized protein YggU (UPF0235/DUF167 family)
LRSAGGGAPWAIVADGLIVTVRLTPRGGCDAIGGVETLADGRVVLKARVRAAPSGGAANAALVALLAKALRVAQGRMAIVAGESARIKRVKISGTGPELATALGAFAEGQAT